MLAILVLTLGLATDIANADFTFGTPTNLGPTVNSTSNDQAPSISADGLSLYFSDHVGAPFRPGGFGKEDLWVTTRQTKDGPWGIPVNLGPTVNSTSSDQAPSISADGLSLYFMSTRPGGSGSHDLWVTTRETKDEPWSKPVNLGSTVNSTYSEFCPNISTDGLSLYFCDYINPRPGGYGGWDIYVTTRATVSEPWGTPVNLGPTVNSQGLDASPNISADGLTLFLNSNRPGALGDDLYVTRRATTEDPWGTPVNLGPTVNESGFDAWPNISADGSTLYFASARPDGLGNVDLWQVSINPVVDLNGDGIVNSADMCIVVDHWDTDDPLCDIGPTPFGDGIVDVQDLIVLAEHLFEDYRLIAHWKLDETQGSIAYDSVDVTDGILNGDPIWQPAGGKIGGALQFDGIDDYVSIPFILDPAKGSFSVFAWVKGGALGQVIISQTGGFGGTWLGTNPSAGKLMTGLSGAYFGALESESVITDGQWHHVGLVYDLDALHRHLYVDGVEVAVDSDYVAGVPSDGGLYIGAAKDLDAGSFFSGLIDDVRVYNQALSVEEIEALAH
ncbi:MAG: LamG-like jellyroll fold domain-containing protein [candidate division Zixibacteria bacterium]